MVIPTGTTNAINGLIPGTTTPNPSTREAFQKVAGISNAGFNSTVNTSPLGSIFGGTVTNGILQSGSGAFIASVNLDTSATSGLATGSMSLNGSAAVSGANIVGIDSIRQTGIGATDVINPITLAPGTGTIYGAASGSANSSATTGNGDAAAAVVDLAGSGIFNSQLYVRNGNLNLSSRLSGNSAATGLTTVGTATAPTDPLPALGDALDGSGVNSILNLNSRGLNGLSQYFEDPISPFFAQFSGLVPGPAPSDPLTSVPTTPPGYGPGNASIWVQTGNIETSSVVASSSSTATNNTGDTNAFSGIFGAGAILASTLTSNTNGNISGTSANGLDGPITTTSTTETGSSSAVTNLLSVGIGTAAVRSSTAAGAPLLGGQNVRAANGSIIGAASNVADTTATSTNGNVVAYTGGLLGSGGNTFATNFNPGNNLTIGLFNVNLDSNNVLGEAVKVTNTTAETGTGNANASDTGITAGLFGTDPAGNSIAVNGAGPSPMTNNVLGEASATVDVTAKTILGNANAASFQTVNGIANYQSIVGNGAAGGLNIGGSASLDASVTAQALA